MPQSLLPHSFTLGWAQNDLGIPLQDSHPSKLAGAPPDRPNLQGKLWAPLSAPHTLTDPRCPWTQGNPSLLPHDITTAGSDLCLLGPAAPQPQALRTPPPPPPPPPPPSWHREPSVCAGPLCSLLGRQLGSRQRKGLALCCTASWGAQAGTAHCLGPGGLLGGMVRRAKGSGRDCGGVRRRGTRGHKLAG